LGGVGERVHSQKGRQFGNKEEGGLEIKDIRLFNDVLLGKFIWHLLSVEGGSWKETI